VDTLVVDKTGTLTEGKPLVTRIEVFAGNGFTNESLLSMAASLERLSEHPLAARLCPPRRSGNCRFLPQLNFAPFPEVV